MHHKEHFPFASESNVRYFIDMHVGAIFASGTTKLPLKCMLSSRMSPAVYSCITQDNHKL